MMAKRIQVKLDKIKVENWKEADKVLKEIAIMVSEIQKEENAYNEREQALRAEMTAKYAPMKEKIQEYELGLEDFCIEHRDDFGDKKSKELSHGTVNFRTHPPSVQKIKGVTWDAVINLIKRSKKWVSSFVRIKEDVDKDAVLAATANKTINASELYGLGMAIEQKESFGYELKLAIDTK
jgi:phage host-nuclease inhibitor protein Gam